MIHVCSLAHLHETVHNTGARHVVTLLGVDDIVRLPAGVDPGDYLRLHVHDITDAVEGQIVPGAEHVERLVHFVRRWNRAAPMVIHCYAGISRSTAAAFTTICALNPNRDEADIAQALRSASPTAMPNARIVKLADQILGRDGRMVSAIAGIGACVPAMMADPFQLDLD
ncbi:MAG TPA: protein-tyrosine phosphatase family protein [Xanthobacteraceae bacterium]|jgi:predicted protein tyrosine phosphatase|nr:protein-tyrosine phosphatase family protein [Xanthobacteraceae bacterium]